MSIKDMAKEVFGELFTDALSNVTYYATFQFLDPFWWWVTVVVIATVAITAVEVAVRFYFADLPWFRKLGGLAILGMILGLVTFRFGEKSAREFDSRRKKPEPPPQEEQRRDNWWPFGR